MGEVYEAKDRFLQDGAIALKTISPEMASSPEAQTRFEKEVLLARQVTHPNVCPIYDLYYHQDDRGVCCFLSMKLLQGETLAARLDRDHSLPPQEAILVIRQVADALHAAHRAGIIHRDIKPSNIMLTGAASATKAVVMDFGLAREFNSARSVGSTVLIGTPAYMAPELIKGQTATAASDLYAFGLVMHEIFGGEQPEGYNSSLKLTPAVRGAGVPPFMPALITGCLEENPNKRLAVFRECLGKLGVDSEVAHAIYQTRPFWTRRRWLVAAGSAGCLVGAGTVWEWDDIFALLHPLPRKRFVALVNWPPTADAQLTPMLSGVIDALERELARAEAFDHDLFVIPPTEIKTTEASLATALGSAGANLMLASSASSQENGIKLSLEILDATAARLFRKKTVRCRFEEVTLLPEMAVQAAAELLGVSQYLNSSDRLKPGTQSPEAYQAFQQAEALRNQPNDTGLDAAIEHFKKAIDADSRFALAHANLSQAFSRLYVVHHDSAALNLALANANTALGLDPNLVEGHIALAAVSSLSGQSDQARAELEKALRLDPSNYKGMIRLGQVLTELNQYQKAEEVFHRVIQVRPNYWYAYNELGYVLLLQGKYREALRQFDSAHLEQPNNALVLENAGNAALKLGLYDRARDNLQKSLSIVRTGSAASDLAHELRAEGKQAEALKYALEAVTLDPQDDQTWLELGDCYSSIPGRKLDARHAYARAAVEVQKQLATDDSDGGGWLRLALYQAKTGNQTDALHSLQRGDALKTSDLDSQLLKARVLLVLGREQEAKARVAACYRSGATRFEVRADSDLRLLDK